MDTRYITRWVALMIQLEQQQHGEFVGGVVGWWLTPTTYIQLTGAGSTARWGWINIKISLRGALKWNKL